MLSCQYWQNKNRLAT